jgi:hypothetical protein
MSYSKPGAKLRRPFIVSLLALALSSILAASPVAAVTFSGASATIVNSGCSSQTSQLSWHGGLPYPINKIQYPQYSMPTGTVYFCWTKFRLSDSDPSGDYYSYVLSSTWTRTGGWPYWPAQMTQKVVSSKASVSNDYGATPTFSSSTGCTSPFSVGFNLGGVGVSVSPSLCSGYTVSRSSYGATGAAWTGGYAGEMHVIETAYFQKVAQGQVPLANFTWSYPWYTLNYTNPYYSSTPVWRSYVLVNK